MNSSISPTSPQKERSFLKFIAYLQIIGIILVVFGHSFHEYPDGSMGESLFFYRLLHNVRMPLFTLVSGYLMTFTMFVIPREKDLSPVKFGINKVKRLLLPFLVLTLVTFVPRATLSGMADDVIELTADNFLKGLYRIDYLAIPFFWFLQMSFILLVFNYSFIYLCRSRGVPRGIYLTIIVTLFALLPLVDLPFDGDILSIRKVIELGIFFVLGICYCFYSEKINRWLRIGSIPTIILSFIVWIGLFICFEYTELVKISSLFGMLTFISVAKLLEEKKIGIFDHMIGANYMIFLLSWYFNVLSQQVLHHFVEMPWWVYSLLSLISGIYVPYLGYLYLKSHPRSRWVRVTAFLLGQNLRRDKGRRPDNQKEESPAESSSK